MRDEIVSDRSNDEKFIVEVKQSGLQVKDGVHFRLQVLDVCETVTLALLIWNPKSERHDNYRIEAVIDLDKVYPEYSKEVDAYLAAEHDHALEGGAGDYDPSMFAPDAVASVLMDQASVLVDNAGPEVSIYVKIDGFEDMVAVERDIARDYVEFSTKSKTAG